MNMTRWYAIGLLACALGFAMAGSEESASSREISPATDSSPLLKQWEGLKYGMFIHFGMSTFAGDEYGHTPVPSKAYAPTKLDVDQWISVARDAGMKYAVLTAKHCYGHCLWPSEWTDYDVTTSSCTTDVVEAFVQACRKYGVRPGFYYLLGWDTCHQTKMSPVEYEAFVMRQVEELLTRYGPITEMWFDIPWDFGERTATVLERLYAHVKRLQPACLVLLNQGFVDGQEVRRIQPSWCRNTVSDTPVFLWPKDLNNGERIPPPAKHNPRIQFKEKTYYIPNEVCDTLLQTRWFWGKDDDPRPARLMWRLYEQSVGQGSNLLLNVPPDNSGRIPEEEIRRLMEVKAMIEDASRVPLSLSTVKPATASNVYHNQHNEWGAEKALDEDLGANAGTRWATDDDVRDAWLEVDLGQPATFNAAFLTEYLDRIRAYELEIPDGSGGWRSVCRGKSVGGPGVTIRFEPVQARKVRLHITDSTGGPTLWNFEIYHLR